MTLFICLSPSSLFIFPPPTDSVLHRNSELVWRPQHLAQYQERKEQNQRLLQRRTKPLFDPVESSPA